MSTIAKFADLVNNLKATTKRTEKESLLAEYRGDDAIRNIFYFVYNPYLITGISSKKVEKALEIAERFENYEDASLDIMQVINYFSTYKTGNNYDVAYLGNILASTLKYKDLITDIVTKDLKIGVQAATLNKVFGKNFVPTFEVMLAKKYFDDPEKLLPQGTDFILTEKLDGVRCVCVYPEGGEPMFFSRQGLPIEGLSDIIQAIKEYLPDNAVYDGELLSADSSLHSKDRYRATVKIVNSKLEDKKNVIYNIFDTFSFYDFETQGMTAPASTRKTWLHEIFEVNVGENNPYLKEVKVLYKGTDQTKIREYLDAITGAGGEGVMINLSDGRYEFKRTNKLLKVKKFETCDVKVLAVNEGTGANAGRLGSVTVEFIAPDNKHYTCDCGSGFSQEAREHYWKHKEELLDKIIEIQYFEISNNEAGKYSLRFPVFLYTRPDKTEISMN